MLDRKESLPEARYPRFPMLETRIGDWIANIVRQRFDSGIAEFLISPRI
jgi:hypothetical protein